MSKITYRVDGMTCGGCAKSVETAIKAVSATAEVRADAQTGLVQVEGVSAEDVAKAVEDAGFTFVAQA